MPIINVPADFPTIQQAVDAAASGDTILIASNYNSAEDVNIYTEGLTFSSTSANTGIVLYSQSVTSITLAGSTPFSLYGYAENNVFVGNSGNNVIDSGEGSDDISGGGGNDTISIFDDGNDTLNGNDGDDTFVIGTGYGGSVTIGGGIGTDTVRTDLLDNLILSSVERLDTTQITATADQLAQFTSIIDSTFPNSQIGINLQGNGGTIDFSTRVTGDYSVNVTATAATAGVIVTGSEKADNLTGSDYDDTLNGGGGNDTINATGGFDTLDGGFGADIFDLNQGNSGVGSVTGGDGSDTVYAYDLGGYTYATVEVLDAGHYGFGYVYGTASQFSSFSTITDNDAGTATQIGIGLQGDGGIVDFSTSVTGTESVNVYDVGVSNGYTVTGSANADQLNGSGYDDTLNGGDGADTITATGGFDTLDGGAGADIFNLYLGDTGVGSVTGGDASDTVRSFNLGGYSFTTVEVLDTVGYGYVYGTASQLGSFSTITDGDTGTATQIGIYLTGDGGTIDFSTRVTGTDSVSVSDQGVTNGYTVTGSANADLLNGSGYDDTLNGGGGNDTITASGGFDTLNGGTGADIFNLYQGGTGTGSVTGGDASDTVRSYDLGGYSFNTVEVLDTVGYGYVYGSASQLGSFSTITDGIPAATQIGINLVGDGGTIDFTTRVTGTDSVNVNDSGVTNGYTVTGSANADLLNGSGYNDTLNGGGGNDTITASGGFDTLNGGAGADIFNLNQGETGTGSVTGGDASDTVRSNDLGAYTFNTVEVLDTTSVTATAAQLSSFTSIIDSTQSSTEFFIYLRGAGGTLDLTGKISGSDRINQVNNNLLTSGITLTGSINADTFDGSNFNDVINGGNGNDLIHTSDGTDTLNGGIGNDRFSFYSLVGTGTINGGDGTDTVEFYYGFGTLDLGTYTFNTVETLDVTAVNGTAAQLSSFANIIDSSASSTLFSIGLRGAGGTIDFSSRVTGSDRVNVYDAGLTAGITVTGSGLADIFAGSAFNDTFNGGNGDDRFYTSGGTDTFNGGEGADEFYISGDGSIGGTVNGGNGTDTVISTDLNNFTYSTVEQLDTANVTGTITQLSAFGSIIDSGTSSNQIVVTLRGAGGTLSFATRITGSDSVNFNGTLATSAVTITGTSIGDVMYGSEFSDTLNGGAGGDTLYGANGIDILEGGTGNDNLFGNGDDTASYAGATAGVTVNLTNAAAQNTVGAGTDLLSGIANLTGSTLNDVLTGNTSANILDGNGGTDTLTGGEGDDTYITDGGDTISEAANQGTDTVRSSVTYTLGANIENLTLIGAAAINGTGNTLNNTITGNSAANTLDGGTGTDTLIGGDGNDTYITDGGDTITELANQGTADTVQSSVTYALGANLENLTLTGAAVINGSGNGLNNTITGNSAANTLNGGTGTDSLAGGDGNDTYITDGGDTITELANQGTDTVQSSATITLSANVENLTLTGVAAINGTGNTLNNTIIGNSAANTLDGGTGTDTLTGGDGNDTYVTDGGDTITELANQGTADTVQSSVTYTLGVNLENLTLIGAAAINGTGNTLNNTIIGNSAANTLDGGTGTDSLVGGDGNDTYITDGGDTITEALNQGTDTVQSSVTLALGANLENLTLTGAAAINGTGNTLNNTITGNSAANTLDGGTGTDTLVGGDGNDTYVTDGGDTITEAANQGTDTVQSSATITLAANLENLTLTGAAAISGTGNGLDNTITGNSGANTLDGGIGNDTLNGGTGIDMLIGGTGNDTFITDGGDTITELADQGTDTVQSSATITLGANLENLTLTGAAAINGTGNTLNNIITGNSATNSLDGGAGNDTLDGGTGTDTLTGGTGNDTYYTDGDDTLVEGYNAGIDSVFSSGTYVLAYGLDNLTLTGNGNFNASGNALNNIITGNSGNNTLAGGTGADTLIGGAGNDIYQTEQAGDLVMEAVGGGYDTVVALGNYGLSAGQEVEVIQLSSSTGSSNFNLSGNEFANILRGNSGNNQLDGKAGADSMYGGFGNDVYIVDNSGDLVFEDANRGTDTIVSTSSYTLATAQHIEALQLNSSTGSTALNLTGNELAQTIRGNAGANVIDGKAGTDTLYGNAGADTFVFSTTTGSGNIDTIADFNVVDDTIHLSRSIFANLSTGALSADAFKDITPGTGGALDASDRILYDRSTGALSYDVDGNGAGTAVQFAILSTKPTALSAADFFVIA